MGRLKRAMTPVAGLTLALALAGCVPASGARSPSSTVAVTTVAATTAPASPAPSASCPRMADPTQMGDLLIDKPTVLYGFNADYMLPDGLPAKPLAVTLQNNGSFVLGVPLQDRAVVEPDGFVITVCNTSTTHIRNLTTFGVRLESLTPYTGSLNALNGCAYLYGSPNGFGGECASGFSPDIFALIARFPAGATLGAVVTQAPSSAVSLSPGQSVTISFEAHPPSNAVIAVYRLGLGVDGAAITYPAALTTQPSTSAPVARHWSGQYCQTAKMQALLPFPLPVNTYFACPQV